MEIEIDPLSSVPIYQQIRDRIVEAVGLGELRQGDGLASVRDLASSFGINPTTAAKSYELLRSEGVVGSSAKSKTFIAADRDTATPTAALRSDLDARLFTLLAEGRAHGLTRDELVRSCMTVIDRLTQE